MTGIIIVDKPEGITSFRAVSRVRGIVGEKKAGHCGTLDPMAEGILPVMLGGATRFLEFLPTSPKKYRAGLKLGVRTDTLDITGTVLETNEVSVGAVELTAALEQFRGDILQIPPMYSAIKKDGVRMYDLARKGVEVERDARPVTIYGLDLISSNDEEHTYVLDIECSSGTYVRTLIDDLGTALGCGAVMTSLRRTAVGCFDAENAVTLEELETAAGADALSPILIPTDRVLSMYGAVRVTKAQGVRFRNGGELDLERMSVPEQESLLYRMYMPDGTFLGLGERDDAAGQMKIKRVFVGR